MGGEVTANIVWMLIVIANAINVDITDEWIPGFGWEVNCSWKIPSNDSLQSVRLSNDGQQFMIYRPERYGPVMRDVFKTTERVMYVECRETEPGGQRGNCVLRVELLLPPGHSFAVKCEVSGERPTFIIEEKEHVVKILVPPSNATIVSKTQQKDSQAHVSLNCSSSGLPAPSFVWTIDGDKHAQADFKAAAWNATSKLWQAWSFYSYTPADHLSTVFCTPIVNIDGTNIKGIPAEFNSAAMSLSVTYLMSTTILLLRLLS